MSQLNGALNLGLDRVHIEIALTSVDNEIAALMRLYDAALMAEGNGHDDALPMSRRAVVAGAIHALRWIRDGQAVPSEWLSSTPS